MIEKEKEMPTIGSLKKLIGKFPDHIPIELWIHAPNFSDIEIDVKIRTLGKTSKADFENEYGEKNGRHVND